jgi:hypothetical protein
VWQVVDHPGLGTCARVRDLPFDDWGANSRDWNIAAERWFQAYSAILTEAGFKGIGVESHYASLFAPDVYMTSCGNGHMPGPYYAGLG